LSRRLHDGCTEREHLQAAARQSGDWSALAMPPMPGGCLHLWQAYHEMAAGRPSGMGGASGIPPSEIAAWQTLSGVQLTPWEIDTILALDQVALKLLSEQQPSDTTP
jgi:hypothetical protein